MRGNGLQAETYVAVADLDPRTADVLLAELRERGVAAYAADSPDPGPGGPVDRLYVDAEAEEQARSLIDDQRAPLATPGDDPLDAASIDSAFADIVAGFNLTSDRQLGAWSAVEELDGPPAAPGVPGVPGVPTSGTGSYTGWADLLRPEPAPAPEPEERYVPPPPPPLPRADLRTRVAWAAVLGGPAVLFTAGILGWHLDDYVLLLAAVAFLAGFVALVAGLKDRDDEDGDDGAVV